MMHCSEGASSPIGNSDRPGIYRQIATDNQRTDLLAGCVRAGKPLYDKRKRLIAKRARIRRAFQGCLWLTLIRLLPAATSLMLRATPRSGQPWSERWHI